MRTLPAGAVVIGLASSHANIPFMAVGAADFLYGVWLKTRPETPVFCVRAGSWGQLRLTSSSRPRKGMDSSIPPVSTVTRQTGRTRLRSLRLQRNPGLPLQVRLSIGRRQTTDGLRSQSIRSGRCPSARMYAHAAGRQYDLPAAPRRMLTNAVRKANRLIALSSDGQCACVTRAASETHRPNPMCAQLTCGDGTSCSCISKNPTCTCTNPAQGIQIKAPAATTTVLWKYTPKDPSIRR